MTTAWLGSSDTYSFIGCKSSIVQHYNILQDWIFFFFFGAHYYFRFQCRKKFLVSETAPERDKSVIASFHFFFFSGASSWSPTRCCCFEESYVARWITLTLSKANIPTLYYFSLFLIIVNYKFFFFWEFFFCV